MQHAFHYWSRLLTICMTHRPLHWQTARFRIDLARPRIMGIVNVTPDSFSDGGQHASAAAALRHCERLLREGANILNIDDEVTFAVMELIRREGVV